MNNSARKEAALITRVIDEMLAAQSRLAVSWRDGAPSTPEQTRDEQIRDGAKATLLAHCNERQRYYEALVNIVALDTIPRGDFGDALGYAEEALGLEPSPP